MGEIHLSHTGDQPFAEAVRTRPRDSGPKKTDNKRKLGSDGPQITTLGIGTWALSGRYQFGLGPQDDEQSIVAIRHALDSGLNWIDTADVYGLGHAEEVVHKATEPYLAGTDVLVFTKCGRSWYASNGKQIVYDLRPEYIRFACEKSLHRLGMERIDLYQIHWPDQSGATSIDEAWGTMAELKREGKTRWIGASNFDAALLDRCAAISHVDSLQLPLSILSRHARRELLHWCSANGTGVIAYSPMASGLLTGEFELDRLAPDDWRRQAAPFQEPKLSQNLALAQRLRPIAERLGYSMPALAVAWTLSAPGVTGAAVGARRRSQVDSWLPAASIELSEEDLAEIENAVAETGAGIDEPPTPPPV
jgi:aryl-alcohol dehydrogenase-like predicted oxidoreductase